MVSTCNSAAVSAPRSLPIAGSPSGRKLCSKRAISSASGPSGSSAERSGGSQLASSAAVPSTPASRKRCDSVRRSCVRRVAYFWTAARTDSSGCAGVSGYSSKIVPTATRAGQKSNAGKIART
jgi:hypothetical protein